jgi:transketolase
MKLLGIPGEFAPTGSPEFLFEHFALTPAGIRKAATALLEETIVVPTEAHSRG